MWQNVVRVCHHSRETRWVGVSVKFHYLFTDFAQCVKKNSQSYLSRCSAKYARNWNFETDIEVRYCHAQPSPISRRLHRLQTSRFVLIQSRHCCSQQL